MEELTEANLLLDGWIVASNCQDAHESLASLLDLVRSRAPIEILVLQGLHGGSKTLRTLGVSGGQMGHGSEGGALAISEAKWATLDIWCRTGRLIQQAGMKRTGKLSVLTPQFITNEVCAIPLRPNLAENSGGSTHVGVALFAITEGRSLRESQFYFLERWSPVLWLVLDRVLRSKSADEIDSAKNAETSRDRMSFTNEAQEAIVGAERGLRAVMERVQIVATSDMPTLILGETGTGKEVVARAIHLRSPRKSKPFIRVNCGAIPTELIDSLLFGHEQGSFTGASEMRKGWFERADGGTLFLDEIGELPLAAQVRLLRVLQEHQIERVGGQEHVHVDVRIVAATHRDLSMMVHQRTFREDLWYRINAFPIILPSLRERVEDIPSLVRHFARRAADRFGLLYVEPLLMDIKQLMDYRWPGNIRELQAVIDRAVILGGGTHLEVSKSLGNTFRQPSFSSQVPDEPTYYEVVPESSFSSNADAKADLEPDDSLVDSLDSAIIRHIGRALAATSGQIEGERGAAKILEINPHTLRAKMRKLKIDWDKYRRY